MGSSAMNSSPAESIPSPFSGISEGYGPGCLGKGGEGGIISVSCFSAQDCIAEARIRMAAVKKYFFIMFYFMAGPWRGMP